MQSSNPSSSFLQTISIVLLDRARAVVVVSDETDGFVNLVLSSHVGSGEAVGAEDFVHFFERETFCLGDLL